MMPGYGLAEHTVYVSDGGPLIRFVNKFALEATSRAIDVCDPMPLPELLKQSSGKSVALAHADLFIIIHCLQVTG